MRPLTRIGFVVGLLALSPAPHAQQPPSAVTLPGLEQALDKITVVEPAPPAQVVQPPAPVVTPPRHRAGRRQGHQPRRRRRLHPRPVCSRRR